MQYVEHVSDTLKYVREQGFQVFVQWLNPGYSDYGAYWDRLGLTNQILSLPSALSIRDGRPKPEPRVQELREVIYGWAKFRNLIFAC